MNEQKGWKMDGFLAIVILLAVGIIGIWFFVNQSFVIGTICIFIALLMASSIIIVPPNEGRVLTFFGHYAGSIRESGMWMTVPLTLRDSVSLKVNNFNSKTIKVNDVDGNPIEIAAVVVYKVVDTAKAMFDVQDYDEFVETQSETALRHVATKYPYDTFNDEEYTLRGNAEEISEELTRELQERLSVAGVKVIESRLTHLAYATEVASAMLQRQQATAIVSARQKIVEGAVGMAKMAVEQLEDEGVVQLTEDRKLAIINNLLVSAVSERAAQPVINTGEIY